MDSFDMVEAITSGGITFSILGGVPGIKKVIFNKPATIILWEDDTKTVVKCGDYEVWDPEKGLAMAIAKKALGNKGNYNNIIRKWLPVAEEIKRYLNGH